MSASKQLASTIIQQMGGAGRLRMFVGTTQFVSHPESQANRGAVSFRFKGSRKYNHLKVTLDWNDTYTMTFKRLTRQGVATREKSLSMVYCDQLIELFEQSTGLYLHF